MVIGLNPSTADETKDDPTLAQAIDAARSRAVDVDVINNPMKQPPTFRELLLSEMARTGLNTNKVSQILRVVASKTSVGSWLNKPTSRYFRQPTPEFQAEILAIIARQPTEPLRTLLHALAERWEREAGNESLNPSVRWSLRDCAKELREVIAKQGRDGK